MHALLCVTTCRSAASLFPKSDNKAGSLYHFAVNDKWQVHEGVELLQHWLALSKPR